MAMKMKYALEQYDIHATVTRLPIKYTGEGCAYGVEVSCRDENTALKIISLSSLSYGKLIRIDR